MPAPVRQEESLGEFLASRARDRSDTRLAGDVIAALLMAIAVGFWRGPAWDLRIGIATCFLAFGLWGIADRDLERPVARSRALFLCLRSIRVAAAAVGFAAAVYVALSLLGRAIGPIIS